MSTKRHEIEFWRKQSGPVSAGIDASVRYNSETMQNMDATAFALMRREPEIARVIALHNAGGDPVKAEALLAEATATAAKQAQLEPTRIIPAEADLADGDKRPN